MSSIRSGLQSVPARLGLLALPLPFLVNLLNLDTLPVQLCMFRAVTGVPCPSCGSTRALARLGALDPLGAFAVNPGMTLLWFAWVLWALLLVTGRANRLPLSGSYQITRARLLVVSIAILVNWGYIIYVST